MKTLGMKLIGGFLLLLLMIVAVAFYSSFASQKSLQDSIGQNSVFVANEMLVNMNMAIYDWLDRLEQRAETRLVRTEVDASNRDFDGMNAPLTYMDRMDQVWAAASKGEISPSVQASTGSQLSQELRDQFLKRFEKKLGAQIVYKLIVTNRYGAIVASSGVSPRYRFDREVLWLKSRESGAVVGDVELDEESGQSVVPLAVQITDSQGNFAGVMLGNVSADSIIRNAVITYKKYDSTQVRLTTREGKLIYSTKPYRFMEDVSGRAFFRNIKGDSGSFVAVDGGRPTLFSHARSQGYLGFAGMPWMLVLGSDVNEVLAPSLILRNNIIIASGILLALGILAALLISRSITRPVAALQKAAAQITMGKLGGVIEVRGRDELGQLAGSFSEMQRALQGVGALAERIAAGDLSVQAVKRSDEDSLGISLENMLENLRRIAGFAEQIASGGLMRSAISTSRRR